MAPAEAPFRLRSLGLSVYLPTVLFAIGQGAALPVIPLFAKDLGASVAFAATIVGLRGWGTMVFDLPAGAMIARFGERRSMLFGTIALAVMPFIIMVSRSPIVFAALVFVMGCTFAIWQLARLAYVTERAPLEVRGRALSLLGGTNRLGNLIGPLVGGVAAEAYGLETAFWLQAVLSIAASAVMYLLVRADDQAPAEMSHGGIYGRFATVVVEHRKVFLTAGLATVAIQVLRRSREAAIPLWGDSIGMSPSQIGFILSGSILIEVLLFYPTGIVMDRWGRKWTGVPCLVFMAIGLMLFPFAHSFTGLLLAGMVTGLGNGFGSGIAMTLGADFSPTIGRNEFLGVWRLVGDIGGAVGPMVIGGLAGPIGLGGAIAASGGIGALGAIVMVFFVTEPLKRARPPTRPRPG
jgi:MFS family permease